MPDSVRHNQKFVDTMHKLHSEIERNVYAAEILCTPSMCRDGCRFRKPIHPRCGLAVIRTVLGDTVAQHDTENR